MYFALTKHAEWWLQYEADLLAGQGQEAVDAANTARKISCLTMTILGNEFKNYPQLLDEKIEELRT